MSLLTALSVCCISHLYLLVFPECGGYFNRSTASLQSPLYPDHYPSNTRCGWQIEQLPGYVIDLVFDEFELEFSVNCTQDYLEVFDGADNTSVSLGRYCGVKKSTDHVTSTGNLMFVEFVANGRITRKGFQVSYTGIKSGTNISICTRTNLTLSGASCRNTLAATKIEIQ